ncbi:squalene synthase HpnC [Azohydromonas aeria]|uniref:squalene synthase HpnC n=1 Tax=Azohydromonas aeria TaxID=2590212 RepID=UPI0012FBC442|nr:squalene synthase HpnC [Azohydromonas aeria]
MSIDHYENFPVASVLCPPALRPAVTAIYHFARTADDIADEGDAPPAQRLAELGAYRAELERCAAGEPAQDARWRRVFEPLAVQMRRHALPLPLLRDLLSAFEQDTGNPRYADRAALLDYCRRSADPIGRLLLHLYGVRDAAALAQSDAICSALQLINFWQDLSVDLPRGRHYVPQADAARHGLTLEQLALQQDGPATRALVRELCGWAQALMRSGAPLVHRLPGRAGWELRLVVQGGLRILEKIDAMNHATLARRPKLGAPDVPRLLWRALGMRAAPPAGSLA